MRLSLLIVTGFVSLSMPLLTAAESAPENDSLSDRLLAWVSGSEAVDATPDFEDLTDFENAEKGFIASLEPTRIENDTGDLVFDATQYDFLAQDAPDSVNASLWRQSQLVSKHGLFKVVDGIYQVRGYDLANITFIEGEFGWIVVDPLLSKETAAAAKQLVDEHLGERPISAVVLTHSHADHYAGIRGLISEQDIAQGLPVVAPAHFVEEAISENVLAGNAMSRRASYMFGALLPVSAEGNIGVGLGPGLSSGSFGLLRPTIDITESGQVLELDGVEFEFILALGAEAPSEFMFYLPQFEAFCQAEIINHTLHNMLTPRGAKVRNGKIWSEYIDEAIVKYADQTKVSFGSHHWPTWGSQAVRHFWTIQRDLYRYIHDQTLRLANQGVTLQEIPHELSLPPALAREFANRGYYGDVGFNARAQYQLYYGFFDGNPANLNPLSVVEESQKYVEYMGGAKTVIERAVEDAENGQTQFAATALNHVVFSDPTNERAREALAAVYRAMATQTEAGPHRNFYLSAALELTQGVSPGLSMKSGGVDTVRAIPLTQYFDLLAVRFNAPKAEDKAWRFNFNVTTERKGESVTEQALLFVSNGVVHHRMGHNSDDVDATLTITRAGLDQLNLKQSGILRLVMQGEASISGNPLALRSFFALVEEPNPSFNIVTP